VIIYMSHKLDAERTIRTMLMLCCSVLQCVAVCCSVLQCMAVCCSVLQCVSAGHSDYEVAPRIDAERTMRQILLKFISTAFFVTCCWCSYHVLCRYI